MFAGSDAVNIQRINEQLETARKYLTDPNLSGGEQSALQKIIDNLTAELEKLINKGPDVNKMAADFNKAWADVYGQFKADQANDSFYAVELERRKKLEEAYNNYVRSGNKETLDQINEYYDSQRREVMKQLKDEEERMQRDLSKSKVDNLEYEKEEALRIIKELEEKRIIAAMGSEEEIAEIRKQFSDMTEKTNIKFDIEIDQATLDDARDSVKNWQEELSDNLLTGLMKIKGFSDQAAVVLADLNTQLIELSANAALSGFEEFGRALGEGEDAAESMSHALAAMAQQILNQLPMMFLQAGLQLIANNQWALGLGFIAAAGSSAIISGYVQGATKHAQGGVFDEYGQTARAFAAGGTFTNQIVAAPTYFAHGGGFGLMGEAGPEAIVPLTRMPNGDLGVQSAESGPNVYIKINNYSGAEVRQEETTGADGSKQYEITIGDLLNRHIASGKADRVMAGRFGTRPVGV